AAAMVGAAATPLAAQGLGSRRSAGLTPMFESWTFGDGVVQVTSAGDQVRVTSATQLSFPVAVSLFDGDRWQFVVSGPFANGTVKRGAPDPTLVFTEYKLNGLADVKFLVTAHLVPDKVMVTLGVNAPSGKTELDGTELEAIRVLGSPALGFQV